MNFLERRKKEFGSTRPVGFAHNLRPTEKACVPKFAGHRSGTLRRGDIGDDVEGAEREGPDAGDEGEDDGAAEEPQGRVASSHEQIFLVIDQVCNKASTKLL